jgi:hypothetical protein
VLGSNFKEVTETSVRVFWWSKYSHYGISNLEAHQPLRNLLLQLCNNDVKGPVLSSISMPANVEVPDIADVSNPIIAISQQPPSCRCYNYSVEQCNYALHNHAQVNNAPSTLSQDYWNFNDSDHDEVSLINGNDHSNKRTAIKRRTNIFEKLNPVFK